ncbi:vitamin K epoxide reductase family protein [Cellulomonas cellasea]|uniref:Vitamin K epoxide reductase n=2 Tax=Cellulomonas cellasea TaxID=43670 RepID=A0A0A0B6C6_9CELL|nr:vitamin K epoxide reductase family protein [Cellulomonas cellasea]KGM01359.1 vitamin K epoxide reductase [Cellulomonas cellasea DSM 20118]MBB2923823.1 putative membrane protein [Cellulomonas cellasea]GEA89538.1 membrane protein [Cellulomonas cellasea]
MTDVLDPTPPTTAGRVRELRHSRGWIFGTMLVSALLSLTASLVLSIEAITLAKDSEAVLGCDINAVISCATVANSWQAKLLGFPNAFLGLIAEPVVITIAVASLGGVRFPRWFMFSAQLVYLIGVVFAYWLFQQSLMEIGALCPWCMLVTISTTLVFASLLHFNIREDNLYLPRGVQRWAKEFVDADNDVIVIAAWLILLAALVVLKHGAALFA